MYKKGLGLFNSLMNMWNSVISKSRYSSESKGDRRRRPRRHSRQSTIMKKNRVKQEVKKKIKNKKYTFKKLISETKRSMKAVNPQNADDILNTAMLAARHIKTKNKNISTPRVIPIPKYGGVLPLIPIFAGLSALGSLDGGYQAIVNAIVSTKNGRKTLNENKQLKKTTGMGAIVVGKTKDHIGLYLRPYKKGYGIFMKPCSNKSKN